MCLCQLNFVTVCPLSASLTAASCDIFSSNYFDIKLFSVPLSRTMTIVQLIFSTYFSLKILSALFFHEAFFPVQTLFFTFFFFSIFLSMQCSWRCGSSCFEYTTIWSHNIRYLNKLVFIIYYLLLKCIFVSFSTMEFVDPRSTLKLTS